MSFRNDFSCDKKPGFTSSGVEIITPVGNENYLNNGSEVIFDQSKLHSFYLELPEGALSYLDRDPTEEKYVEGSLTFNGETISPVGIRYKGSYGAFVNGVSKGLFGEPSGYKISTKLSMKVKIDWKGYQDTFYGLKKLQFHAMPHDPSQLRERLGYWLFREMGVHTPRAVHVKLYINGVYNGLFTLVEQIDEQFTAHTFGDGSGNIYKERWPIKSNGKAAKKSDFYNSLVNNEVAGTKVDHILEFAQAIEHASAAERPAIVDNYMDTDEILRYIAVDRFIRHDDGIFHWYCTNDDINGCNPHNFYWYENPVDNKIYLIPWDLDNAFENITADLNPVTPVADDFGETQNNCQPFTYGEFNIWQKSASCDPLIEAWASHVERYDQIKQELIQGVASKVQIEAQINEWTIQIMSATAEAAELHEDAVSMIDWESSVNILKETLEYARTK